jgi:hypothetical protein
MVEYQVKPLDYAAVEALVRRAQAERAKVMGDWIARGAKALVRGAWAIGDALRAHYTEAMRAHYRGARRQNLAQAQAALERWAGRY